jgi:hypothetical protein
VIGLVGIFNFLKYGSMNDDNGKTPPALWAVVTILVAIIGAGATIIAAQLNKTSPNAVEERGTHNSEPLSDTPQPSPSSASIQLVGVWQADAVELGIPIRIIWHIKADGSSQYQFTNPNGVFSNFGTWRYTNNIIYETYPDGSSAKGSIEWISNDHFVLTILDNGVPAYSGLKRNYFRVPL